MIARHKISGSFYLDCMINPDGQKVISEGLGSLLAFVLDKNKEKDYFFYHSDSEVQKMIESAVAEHEKSISYTIQAYRDNEQQLLEQIEQLKAKVPQPIELSKEYCAELDRLLLTYIPMSVLHRCIHGYQDTKLLHSVSLGDLVKALTDGYTVKPEPTLQDQIENILRSLEYDFEGVESAAKEIVIVLKHEGLIKDEES